MKAFFLIALVFLPIIFASNYVVPDLGIDETEPDCSNVNALLATATSDTTRLTNYVTITLPNRIEKLNSVYASVGKTCKIIQSRSPSLLQHSSYMAKKKMFEIQSLRNIQQDIKVLAAVAIGNKCEKSKMPCITLTQIKAKLYALSNAVGPSELCDDVKDAVVALANYLKWLGPAVQTTYIDGKLADRISLLTSFGQSCASSECKGDGSDQDTDVDGGDGGNGGNESDSGTGCKWLFGNGQEVALKCLGSIVVSEHTYLDSLTSSGGVQLAPQTTGGYTGTHFKVQHNEEDCSYSFQSLGSDYNANYQWVDGRTGDGSVGLAPITSGGYSGTHWDVSILSDGSYALKCLGSDYNANHLYLDGRTVDGSVGLAPVTTGGYSGTHWDIFEP